MHNQTYNDYIRSILGYPIENSYNNYQNYDNNIKNYQSIKNSELENCYPEIYKIVYPMITKKCSNTTGNLTNEEIENMTDEIYNAIEERNEIQLNINLTNEVKNNSTQLNRNKIQDKKPEVNVKETQRQDRQIPQTNRGLRDLIKILIIRELLNRPGRPPMQPRPPMPGPRPPMRPPMRPPFGPGAGNIPFNREYENFNYDIYEY